MRPLDDGRRRLADDWGDAAHLPLPSPWDTLPLDALEVQAAYLSFCRRAIERYDPDYLAIGLEVNLLRKLAPDAWDAYVVLHRATYEALKREFPALPVFVTLTAVDLLEGWTDADHAAQMDALADVLPYTDLFALSLYPYMSRHLVGPYPPDLFTQLESLAGGRPVAIAESGFPAQRTALPSYGVVFEGTEEAQRAWVEQLLAEADRMEMPFVVNFVWRDYDALWTALGGGDLLAVWRDTGLYDEAGRERAALAAWRAALSRPRR